MSDECPKCHGANAVPGSIAIIPPGHAALGVVFRPDEMRNFALTMTGGIELGQKVFACQDCGLVWTSVSAVKIADFVDEHCRKPA